MPHVWPPFSALIPSLVQSTPLLQKGDLVYTLPHPTASFILRMPDGRNSPGLSFFLKRHITPSVL
jgi:hypothetical protein